MKFKMHVLNEKYMEYYRKDDIPFIRQYKLGMRVKLVFEPLAFTVESDCLDAGFFLCLNNPSSITNLIRANECDMYFMHEQEIEVAKTIDAITAWKTALQEKLGKISRLRLIDLGLKSKKFKQSTPVIETVNYRDCDVSNDGSVIYAFQLMFPFYAKDGIDKELLSYVVDTLKDYGYNYVNIGEIVPKSQKMVINPIHVALVQFEAVYTELISKLSDDLFHVTSLKAFGKIVKNGIVPQAVTSGDFQHPARAYLFSGASMQDIMTFIEEKANVSRYDEMCLLRVDGKKLMSSPEFKSGKMLFYVDPMFSEKFNKTAIFTDSPIPVKFIDDAAVVFKRSGKKFAKCGIVKLSDAKHEGFT